MPEISNGLSMIALVALPTGLVAVLFLVICIMCYVKSGRKRLSRGTENQVTVQNDANKDSSSTVPCLPDRDINKPPVNNRLLGNDQTTYTPHSVCKINLKLRMFAIGMIKVNLVG